MARKILFIEDNKTKAEEVKNYIFENYNEEFELTIKESFTSGLRELFLCDYDLLLVDMSLPTREGHSINLAGNHEQLGGHRILSEMKRKKKLIPTVLITMFSEFGINESFMDITELDHILTREFNDFYKGYVFFSSKQENWKSYLKHYIDKI